MSSTASGRMAIAPAMDRLVEGRPAGALHGVRRQRGRPPDAAIGMHLRSERGLSYLVTAPGDLGLARAYVSGDLDLTGVHPGDPYDLLVLLKDHTRFRVPPPSEALALLRGLGVPTCAPPPPPPQEHLPRWRRAVEGLRHSMMRDAEVIARHYDVSNRFYELVLGPSMAYTCALYQTAGHDPRAGAGGEVRPGLPQARPEARATTARRRLRLGQHGPPRRPGVRRRRRSG